MNTRRITSKEAVEFIVPRHYSGRKPNVSMAWGLFDGSEIVGAITIGKPASAPLCVGVCGPEMSPYVYELNRMVIADDMPKNSLSKFLGQVLSSLKSEKIILISFADSGAGHSGYIYQATNWTYTGATVERTDKYMPGNKHPRHYTEEFARYRRLRTSKHRYLYVPNKSFRRRVMQELRYPVESYPKGENGRYRLGDYISSRVLDTETGRIYAESELNL